MTPILGLDWAQVRRNCEANLSAPSGQPFRRGDIRMLGVEVLASRTFYANLRMRMLLDHRQALSFRTVERVVLLKQKQGTNPTFMILLSSPRDVEIPT